MAGAGTFREDLAALAEIGARATTLDERLALAASAGPNRDGADAEGQSLLAAWERTIGRGTRELFARRLAWDGIDAAELARTLAPPAVLPDRLPAWLTILQSAYGWGQVAASADADPWDVGAPADRALDPQGPLPFEELLAPLCRYARAELRRRAGQTYEGVSGPAHAQLERVLMRQLVRVIGQALYLAFGGFLKANPDERAAGGDAGYRQFVRSMQQGGLLAFFRQHSVAARLCASVTRNWVDFVAEFLDRLERDRPGFRSLLPDGDEPGPVVSVDVGISDAHDGGRGVIICRFASGGRLVYKPRPLGLERFFDELVRWSNATGEVPALRAVKVHALATHGWVEWIGPAPCGGEEEVRGFYHRCGMLLGLLYGIQGTDVHSGNLLASGDQPVLIDAETLLTHRFALVGQSNESLSPLLRLYDLGAYASVLRVHMLPFMKFTPDGRSADFGAISLRPPGESASATLDWTDVNTDAMKLVPRPVPVETPRNLPILDDRLVGGAGYLEAVLAGFRQMYRLLLARRDQLLAPGAVVDGLGSEYVRFVFRHTSLYTSLLERTLHPQFLRDGAARSIEIDVLARPLLEVAERPTVWPLLQVERRALEQLDVPLFASPAGAVTMALPDGQELDCFQATATAEVRRRLMHLSAADERLQEDLIRSAFAAAASPGLVALPLPAAAVPASPAPLARVRQEAERLGQLLADRAYLGAEAPLWMMPSYVPSAGRHQAGVGRPALLDGVSGVALALAAVAAVTDRGDLASLARRGLQPLLASPHELGPRLARATWDAGLGTGVASCAYGLLRVGQLLNDADLLNAVPAWAALLQPSNWAPRTPHDLVAGRAGALLMLVRLHAATGTGAWLDQAASVADDLLAQRQADPHSGCRGFTTSQGLLQAGLAHGQSGIAYALAEAAAALARPELRQAADEAIALERRLLGDDLGRVEQAEGLAAWSYGATGVGLARAGMLRLHDDADARRDLIAAVEITRRHLFDGADDLASGALARLELLAAAAGPLERPELEQEARDGALKLLARAEQTGRYRLGWLGDYQHPGLFQGLAGIAHAWARLLAPDRVRSVALWA